MAAIVLAALCYGLIAVMAQLELGNARAAGAATPDRFHLPWLQGSGRGGAAARDMRPRPRPRRDRCEQSETTPAREPLVLIDGETGASRPWQTVTPHLEFGFDVLAGVLPRDGSLDGTTRAMDRVGWQTAHVVARPCDAAAAVDLARLGRARSLLILSSDAIAGDSAVAAEIADAIAFRPAS